MCRFVAYHGPPIHLDELLYQPKHSLIHQSTHAMEREEPLNGDGWGVGWYDPTISRQPGLYRTIRPAWSDENMRHVSPLVETPVFMAHVRAASPGLAVQQLNCHPFRGGQHTHEDVGELDDVGRGRRRLLFMHNGKIGGYKQIIRRLNAEFPDDIFFGIQGTTDSEHAFAEVQRLLDDAVLDPSPEELFEAICKALSSLDELKDRLGHGDAQTEANVCITDGRSMVATRYGAPDEERAPSLYVGQAEGFYCDEAKEFKAVGPDGTGSVLIASERLWDDDRVWERLPPNHAVLVDADRNVEIRAMAG